MNQSTQKAIEPSRRRFSLQASAAASTLAAYVGALDLIIDGTPLGATALPAAAAAVPLT
jgi:hypothetical protein